MDWDYAEQIWDELMKFIDNETGVAALMGNFAVESGCIPFRVQGDIGDPTYTKSIQYTSEVSSTPGSSIQKNAFVNDSKGYSLAQWTYSTRKKYMYDLWYEYEGNYLGGGYYRPTYDFGSVTHAIHMVKAEFTGKDSKGYPTLPYTTYSGTYRKLKSNLITDTLKKKTEYVMKNYEQPADQSAEALNTRYEWAKAIYEKFTGRKYKDKKKGMPIYMMLRSPGRR